MDSLATEMEAANISSSDVTVDMGNDPNGEPEDMKDPSVMNSTTRFVVVEAPLDMTEQVVSILSDQPEVDWIEKTPELSFLNKWAKGVTQTGNWKVGRWV